MGSAKRPLVARWVASSREGGGPELCSCIEWHVVPVRCQNTCHLPATCLRVCTGRARMFPRSPFHL
eukprot:11071318-Alexandrium_andersonii.AAC.1